VHPRDDPASQDGERVIVCGDCGREFAKLAEDDAETLVVPVLRAASVILLDGDLRATQGVAVQNNDGWITPQPIYPCARCGWSASAARSVEGEDCHT
jgi:hypothetical protein